MARDESVLFGTKEGQRKACHKLLKGEKETRRVRFF